MKKKKCNIIFAILQGIVLLTIAPSITIFASHSSCWTFKKNTLNYTIRIRKYLINTTLTYIYIYIRNLKKKKIDIFFKEFSPMFHGHSDKFLDQLEPLNNVINLPCSYHAHATNNAQHRTFIWKLWSWYSVLPQIEHTMYLVNL